MTPTTPESELTQDLIDRVRKLSPSARDELLLLLVEEQQGPSDDPESVRKEWQEEIARRITDIEAGRVELLDAEESLDRIERKLREPSGG